MAFSKIMATDTGTHSACNGVMMRTMAGDTSDQITLHAPFGICSMGYTGQCISQKNSAN